MVAARNPRRLHADRVVTPNGVLQDAVIEIGGDRVVSCEPYAAVAGSEPERVTGWVVPGLVDIHVHGGNGCDYATEDPQAGHRCTGVPRCARHDVQPRQPGHSAARRAPAASSPRSPTWSTAGTSPASTSRGRSSPQLSRERTPVTAPLTRPGGRGPADRGRGRGHLTTVTLARNCPGAERQFARVHSTGAYASPSATPTPTAARWPPRSTPARPWRRTCSTRCGAIHHRKPGPVPLLLTDPRVAVELIADRHPRPS